ncbi:MAG: putative ABC transport system permease protein [Flavobacteriales bacterium]|jgi:putative ABC transport system permease protein|tara:strand:+ start:1401 stop:2612 length:1212 start_codon:yes stop_codon:yes gene_type:complete
MLLRLAWRNIWRNKRRTLITLGMIQFAVVLATLMATIRDGIMDIQVENVVGGYQGYAAINDTGYVEEPSIDYIVPYNDSVQSFLKSQNLIKSYSPRIIGGGIITRGEKFKIGRIVGVNPALEDSLTHFSKNLVKGRMHHSIGEVVLGLGLAERLKADLDSVVFITGMGYQGNTANLMLKVVGIIKLSNIQENKRLAFVTLEEAREGFALYEGVNQIVLGLRDNTKAKQSVKKLKKQFTDPVQIYSWNELNVPLYMLVEVNDAVNIIVSAMLYFIISFGLFGTILMMLAERKREFGMLIAIGMKKSKLSYITYLENTFMAIFGTALGFVIAIPVVYYLNQNPVTLTGRNAEDIAKFGFEPLVRTSMNFNIFMWQAISVLGISLFFSLYPILKIRSMNENKAMKG